jgi:hypothetical protein
MEPRPRPVDAVTTIEAALTRQPTQAGNGTARPSEDPRKVALRKLYADKQAALRELYAAQQRLIDAEDALSEARAHVTEKTKAYDAIGGKRP